MFEIMIMSRASQVLDHDRVQLLQLGVNVYNVMSRLAFPIAEHCAERAKSPDLNFDTCLAKSPLSMENLYAIVAGEAGKAMRQSYGPYKNAMETLQALDELFTGTDREHIDPAKLKFPEGLIEFLKVGVLGSTTNLRARRMPLRTLCQLVHGVKRRHQVTDEFNTTFKLSTASAILASVEQRPCEPGAHICSGPGSAIRGGICRAHPCLHLGAHVSLGQR